MVTPKRLYIYRLRAVTSNKASFYRTPRVLHKNIYLLRVLYEVNNAFLGDLRVCATVYRY